MFSFARCPIAMKKDYRLYVIHKLPNLRTLDYNRITEKEREAARKLYKTKSGEKGKKKQKGANTFVPGEELAKQQQQQPQRPQAPRLSKKDVEAIKVGFIRILSFLKRIFLEYLESDYRSKISRRSRTINCDVTIRSNA